VFFVLVGITAPPYVKVTPVAPVVATPVPQQAQPEVPASTQSNQVSVDQTKQIVASLSQTTSEYESLYINAKDILGSSQYANAEAGRQALKDPSSSASKLSEFRINNCLKNDVGQKAMDAYKHADDLYYSANVASPDSLSSWNDDMGDVSSNICIWANDAISWQIKETPTSKIQADEKKITDGIMQAKKDIQLLN
jgi:predicted 3-demethylubiquinone-9 3-methyltransferase (glyoxalase superfamily)